MKILNQKLKEKKEKKAKQKLENDLTAHLTPQEKQEFENANKKEKFFDKLSIGLFGSSIAVAIANGYRVVGDALFDFSHSISNYFATIIPQSVEHIFMNAGSALLGFVSIAIPFALSFKAASKSGMYGAIKDGYKLKSNLRKDGTKKDLQKMNKSPFLSKAKAKNDEKATKGLEWLNEKLTEEEVKQLERHINTKKMKRHKVITYALAGTTIVLSAILGHQLVDGAILDISQPIGENIKNFFSTGSIYESGLSFKDNLYYMFYSAIENFETSKLPLAANAFLTLFSFYFFSNARDNYKAEKKLLEQETNHKQNLVSSFFAKLRDRKNNLVEQSPSLPIIEVEETKSKLA